MSKLTYTTFQVHSVNQREYALKWLRGRVHVSDYIDDLVLFSGAANDAFDEDILPIIAYQHNINMLYHWVDCGRDELIAKLSYVA